MFVPGSRGCSPQYAYELPAPAGAPPVGGDVDPDHAAREADQDRGEGGAPRPGGDVPAGGGGSAPGVVRGDPGADRSAATGAEPRVIVVCGWMRVASSRGGRGWSAGR